MKKKNKKAQLRKILQKVTKDMTKILVVMAKIVIPEIIKLIFKNFS